MVEKAQNQVSIRAQISNRLFVSGELPDGSGLRLIPEGLAHEAPTKCILGNGVVINPLVLLTDFDNLKANGIDYKDRLLISQRSHLVTAYHAKVTERLKEIRKDTGIWLSAADVAYAYKPLKMGLRVSNLAQSWSDFEDSYDRVNKTCQQLFRIELSKEDRDTDLENFKRMRDVIKKNQMIHDTSFLLCQEIGAGKRILAEDCSSSMMDEDHGIYPYTDSFHTTTGSVCTGLGVPDEAIETEIGVMSAVTLLKKSFLKHINCFPTLVEECDPSHASIWSKLESRYGISKDEFIFGWLDLNHVQHVERLNQLSSIFVTHLDLLDDLEEFKICTSYTVQSSSDSGEPH